MTFGDTPPLQPDRCSGAGPHAVRQGGTPSLTSVRARAATAKGARVAVGGGPGLLRKASPKVQGLGVEVPVPRVGVLGRTLAGFHLDRPALIR